MQPINVLHRLKELGQSPWLDDLDREMIRSGRLERLIHDGISGITSNPATFKRAIADSDAYGALLRTELERGAAAEEIYESLAVRDVRDAADLLAPIHESTGGRDGFVSLEVSPRLARDTEGTVTAARRLWSRVGRPNVLIKIPGTIEGLPAIERCLFEGINVNVTLLFSLGRYREVHRSYMSALARRQSEGRSLRVASVASLFLSRIDSKVDARLDEFGTDRARRLRGRIAVASAKMAYQSWLRALRSARWEKLARAGAGVQRLLWASTSTKDPAYGDVKYVEPLIGAQTVTTLPEKTLEAFRDHGRADRTTIGLGVKEERAVLKSLAGVGLDLDAITEELALEGVQKFVDAYDELMRAIEHSSAVPAARSG